MFPVSLQNYHFEEWQLTFNLKSGITQTDRHKAVTLDASADNTVKLAGDGDPILGRLEIIEDRQQEGTLLGTIALKFGAKLPIKSGETVNVGDYLVGAGDGEVKAAPATVADDGTNSHDAPPGRVQVVAVESGFATAIAL